MEGDIKMSISVHVNGRKRSEMKSGLIQHQERDNEEQGETALRNTDSILNPKLSHMNVSLVRGDSSARFSDMRKKLDVINEKRIKNGQRKVRKDANVLLVGTVQLGDDTLELLGWVSDEYGVKLPADKQSEQTLKNVRTVYDDALQSIKSQPDVYGDIFSATLHFEESSPHVDYMADPLDVERINQFALHFLNGEKGKTPRGKKTRNMQDKIMTNSKLSKETIEKFDIKRGDTEKTKKDKIRRLRQDEKLLEKNKKALDASMADIEKLAKKVSDDASKVFKREQAVAGKENELKGLETSLNVRERQLSEREGALSKQKNEINQDLEKLQRVKTTLQGYYTRFKDFIRHLPEQSSVKALESLESSIKALEPIEDNQDDFLSAVNEITKTYDKDRGRQM